MNRSSLVGMSLLGLLLSAGLAAAQDNPPLKGPEVKDQGAPGEGRRFGGQAGPKDRMAREIPPRAYLRAFDVLRGDKAEESVRLTQAQDEQLRKIETDFRDSVQAYMAEHKDEIEQLKGKLGPNERRRLEDAARGQGAGRPAKGEKGNKGEKGSKAVPADDAMTPDKPSEEEAQAARAKLKELMAGAPKPADAHSKMWAVLTDAQKPVVQKELDRLKQEARSKAARPDQAKPGAGNSDELPPAVRERLKNLPPEEREKALERIKERRKNAENPPK